MGATWTQRVLYTHKHYKCQMVLEFPASGRHYTGEKDRKCVAPYLLRVSAWFLLSELSTKTNIIKLKWGQSVACFL
jgi:hypothetical protein